MGWEGGSVVASKWGRESKVRCWGGGEGVGDGRDDERMEEFEGLCWVVGMRDVECLHQNLMRMYVEYDLVCFSSQEGKVSDERDFLCFS